MSQFGLARGYLDAAPRTQVAMAVKSSLLFGMGRPSSELQLAVGEAESAGDGLFYVDIEMSIPMSILTIQESDSGYDAEASLFAAALDASGAEPRSRPLRCCSRARCRSRPRGLSHTR